MTSFSPSLDEQRTARAHEDPTREIGSGGGGVAGDCQPEHREHLAPR
jgi:hypothetical protein